MQRPFGVCQLKLGGCLLLAVALEGFSPIYAQAVLAGTGPAGTVNIFNTDLAVLESGETRKDLPCTVTPSKPTVGFDLRFHAGYEVSVPLKELSGGENLLNILFRVEPHDHPDQPIYFTQHIRVPALDDDAKGDAYLQGTFDLGEGQYHIDWLMRDRGERVCSFSWDEDAALTAKDRPMTLTISPDAIQRTDAQQFQDEPPVQRATSQPLLNVKVLVNFAPQNSLSATLQPLDTAALVSILRSIVRDPRIGKFSLVAFNMQDQRVVYRQEDVDRLDFPSLGRALNSLNLGTVDLKKLGEKHGDTEFLTNLVRTEVVGAGKDHPDAVVFAGPKVLLDANVPEDSLRETGSIDFPVFYMNYNLYPQAVPWKDAISRTVHFFRGYEYTITKPRDLWVAVSEMVSRIVKSRNGKQAPSISSQ